MLSNITEFMGKYITTLSQLLLDRVDEAGEYASDEANPTMMLVIVQGFRSQMPS